MFSFWQCALFRLEISPSFLTEEMANLSGKVCIAHDEAITKQPVEYEHDYLGHNSDVGGQLTINTSMLHNPGDRRDTLLGRYPKHFATGHPSHNIVGLRPNNIS